MQEETIYKSKKSLIFGGLILIIFVLLAFAFPLAIQDGPVSKNELFGVTLFLIVSIVLAIVPLGGKLEVGKDYIKSSFFGLKADEVRANDVEKIVYGNVIAGGLGFGKGIKFWVSKDGKKRLHSLSEMTYGKEAIMHIKQVLEAGLK